MVFNLKIKIDYWEKLTETFEKYQTINEHLGQSFYAETDKILERIKERPFLYQIKYKNYRQALVKKFPYQIIYEVIESEIIVYTLFPTKNNPEKKPK